MSFFPPYYACNFVNQTTLDEYPELNDVLSMLDGKISEQEMADMNSKVDVCLLYTSHYKSAPFTAQFTVKLQLSCVDHPV